MRPKSVNYSDSAALEASRIIKASPGTLFSVIGLNSGGAQYIQIHDSATLPANDAVPKIVFSVEAGKNFSYDLQKIGRFFKNGIVVTNSSTVPTKTIGAADCWFSCQYV